MLPIMGFRNLPEFLTRAMGLSERSARYRIREMDTVLASVETLNHFVHGQLGLAHFLELGWLAGEPAWVDRARRVTCRQLARELRFRRRLRLFDEGLPWFLPDEWPDLESALRRELFRRGVNLDAVDRDLERRGLGRSGAGGPADPARDPAVLSRLEILLDLVVLTVHGEATPESDPRIAHRQTLSGRVKHHRVTIQARPQVVEHWERVRARLRGRMGPLPDWAVATLVVTAAVREWDAQDREYRATEFRILERDNYRCQVPGCSARRHLEVHHIIFRSHQGPDADWNLITLCHAHHHHAVHTNTVRVRGRAPHALVWEMGSARGRPPRRVYHGETLHPPRPARARAQDGFRREAYL
jgi:hypothetical protein